MFRKQIILALTALLALQLCACHPVKEADETEKILEFFNEIDKIYADGYKQVANLILDFLNDCINAVPSKDRGASTAILVDYKNELVKARDSGDKDKLQEAIKHFDQFQQRLTASLAKMEKEDEHLQVKLLGVLGLVMKMMEASVPMQQKMTDAGAKLRQQFSPEGIKRHQELFDILDELQTNADMSRTVILNAQLEVQKNKYQSIQANENLAIVKFLNDVDRVKLNYFNNVASAVLNFLSQSLGKVPQQDRGSTSAILEDYINDVASAKHSGNAGRLDKALNSFQQFKNHLNKNTKKMTNEDRILLAQLQRSTEVAQNIQQAEKTTHAKELELAENLRKEVSAGGIKRHQKFFDVLDEIKTNNDVTKSNEISNEYEVLRANYLSNNH